MNKVSVETLKQIVAVGASMMGATTSNNERDFSALCQNVPPHVKLLLRRLQSDFVKDRDPELCRAAQKIWCQGFGMPRRSGTSRRRPNWHDVTKDAV